MFLSNLNLINKNMIKKLLKRIITTRLRVNFNYNPPKTLFAIYVFGKFLEAGRYNHKTAKYEGITENEYFENNTPSPN